MSSRQILENNDAKFVSSVSLWEISIKYSLGKLELGGITPNRLFQAISEAGFELLNISNELLVSYYRLPKKSNHRDPFDRLLIWQAISDDYILLTHDTKFAQYRHDGLKVIIS